eukprot:NODE_15948_length_317_cov_10.723881_g14782_i0.p3 GENE.NODE_15948_length_317_cov_10.723881_g14782_i0~~NODE_15948_length_317_cov_10.723881_g14782_i0.p3  ORF type:complete len:76 (+),score=12.74 NODE_15948_length_317_cov_10.723881_g14782_i0:64-291(+)
MWVDAARGQTPMHAVRLERNGAHAGQKRLRELRQQGEQQPSTRGKEKGSTKKDREHRWWKQKYHHKEQKEEEWMI